MTRQSLIDSARAVRDAMDAPEPEDETWDGPYEGFTPVERKPEVYYLGRRTGFKRVVK